MARPISHIVVHCTATPQHTTVASILNYWATVKKWKKPGYHYIIEADGTTTQLLDEKFSSNGVAGYNYRLINISYIGGVDQNNQPNANYTQAQHFAMVDLVKKLLAKYPFAKVAGHNQFTNKKACPSFYVPDMFDAEDVLKSKIFYGKASFV